MNPIHTFNKNSKIFENNLNKINKKTERYNNITLEIKNLNKNPKRHIHMNFLKVAAAVAIISGVALASYAVLPALLYLFIISEFHLLTALPIAALFSPLVAIPKYILPFAKNKENLQDEANKLGDEILQLQIDLLKAKNDLASSEEDVNSKIDEAIKLIRNDKEFRLKQEMARLMNEKSKLD